MKTKLIFVLLGLPLVLLSFTKASKAKAFIRKTSSRCDTAFLYPALIFKQAAPNLATSPTSLVVTDETDGSRAKLQLKAYLDSLTIDGNPAILTGLKKEARIKNTGSQKRTVNSQKTNNVSQSGNRAQSPGNGVPSDQFPVLYDPDDTNPPVLGARNK